MTTTALDYAIDVAMGLPLEQQEMLVEIIHRRHAEVQREEMAADVRLSVGAFNAGELKPQSAAAVIRELHRDVDDLE